MTNLTPLALTNVLDGALMRVAKRFEALTEKSGVLAAVGLALGAVFGVATSKFLPNPSFVLGHFAPYVLRYHLGTVFLALSAIFFSRRAAVNFSLTAAALVTFGFCSYSGYRSDGLIYLPQAVMEFTFAAVTVWWIGQRWATLTRVQAWLLVSPVILIGLFFPVLFYLVAGFGSPYIVVFRTIAVCLMMAATMHNDRQETKTTMRPVHFVLSPILFVYSFPVQPQMFPRKGSDTNAMAAGGLMNLCGGMLALAITALVYKYLLYCRDVHSAGAYLWLGWTNYIFYYFGFLSSAHLAVGLARWLGFDAVSPAQHSLFAANPLDRWRRWNIYFYWMLLTFVWLPLARNLRSVLLATFAVFAYDFLWHNASLLDALLMHQVDPKISQFLIRDGFCQCLQAVVVYISLLSRRFWPAENTRAGWLGVGLTHLLMAVVHGPLRFY